jgi:hypothetical protein
VISQYQKRNRDKTSDFESAKNRSDQSALLLASGLITGEALIGILLAIPVAITQSSTFFALVDESPGSWPGVIVIVLVCAFVLRSARKAFLKT